MTDRETLEGIVNRFYEVRGSNDKDGVMSFAGPNFSFCMAGSGKLAAVAPRVCEPELEAAVEALIAHWDMSRMVTKRLFVDGDTVIAHRAGTILHNPSGKEVETEYLDVFTFEDVKMVDLTEYVDTLMVAETLGLVNA